jgi:hypothetical protein
MLTIVGPEGRSEYLAAQDLAGAVAALWPDVGTSRLDHVALIAGVKCFGQKRTDIDLVVLIQLSAPRTIGASVKVESCCLVVEVKDHLAADVRFQGNKALVRYKGKWSDASEQSHEQLYSFKNYLEGQKETAPFISAVIWFRNLSPGDVPPQAANVIAGSAALERLLRATSGSGVIDHFQRTRNFGRVRDLFSRMLQPSSLDRAKMEKTAKRILVGQRYEQHLGKQLLVFRGRGGTGKTARLVQLAHNLFRDKGDRVLVLTYNVALVADLRRLLALMGIGYSEGEAGIHVQSVHSFVRQLLVHSGTLRLDSPDAKKNPSYFFDHYDRLVASLVETLSPLTMEERREAFSGLPEALNWDHLFIDEAQDWPQPERQLVYQLYGHRDLVLADGIDQLVRSNEAADWLSGIPKDQRQVVPLKRSLRLKHGLCRFAARLADKLGVTGWDLQPEDDLSGGRVIVVEGDYLADRSLHDELMRELRTAGNAPVDSLICVPPTHVQRSSPGAQQGGRTSGDGRRSLEATRLGDWGLDCWDGSSRDVRESFPERLEQVRIVQYDSCRGLEGWAVVCIELDVFFDHKVSKFSSSQPQQTEILFDRSKAAHASAAQWAMIPVTRAIDTLVITLRNPNSILGRALAEVNLELGDLVSWRRVSGDIRR